MAQELEDVLGGVYTVQSQELQLPIVTRIMAVLREEGDFPQFPSLPGRKAVVPTIITGFDALGRGHELNRLRAFYADAVGFLGEAQAQQLFDPDRTVKRLATFHNVDVEDMLATPDERSQRLQQARGMQVADTLLDKAAAPLAKAYADRQLGGDN